MSLCLMVYHCFHCSVHWNMVSVRFLMSHSFLKKGIFLCKKRVTYSTAALWVVQNMLFHPSWCNTEDVEVMCISFHSFGSPGCQFWVGERSKENSFLYILSILFLKDKNIINSSASLQMKISIKQNLCRIGGVMCNVKIGSGFKILWNS